MDYVCSVVFICQSFDLIINRRVISFKKNSLFIVSDKIRRELPVCPSKLRIVDIDKKTCLSFFIDVNNELPGKFTLDKNGYIAEEEPPLSLVFSLFEGIKIADSHSLWLKERLCISLLAMFKKRESVNSFILTNINTFTCKITGIISFNIERQWHLKDIAELIYTSESLIKKRLRDEGTSFTEILRDTRMRFAKKLITSNSYSINVVAQKCGYNSTSYFICAFKDYYGVTPSHYFEKIIGVTDGINKTID